MLNVWITGDKEVITGLTALPDRMRKRLATVVQRLGFKLQRQVQAGKLSGQVLRVRTGVLRSSINLKVNQTGNEVTASVGTRVSYGRVHEFGFTGTQSVRAHLRQVKQVFGRPVAATQHVSSHTRRVRLPERSFLRSALKDMGAEIRTELTDAIRDEAAKAVRGR